ncbi:glycine cleavage system protein R [Candidatus Nitrosacidococcus sp. I8]|uniref:glycine cleavage system protein R n=1 Tax=Candidatus Nitrosacidococcus sp. I8 TaxID=2942908 RepID=UPI002226A118|nr:ACT domain-containing protein [Candidatus Nitrosacidococcus sp. I8]CAH9019114.1 Glycine cleavage system transcriptional repressor [Candidatus Nitrosacidococcus sp. I8]
MEQHLVILAIGKNQPNLLKEVGNTILNSGCNIKDSRVTLMGSEFSISLFVSGSWNTIAKLESMLPILKQKLALSILTQRTQPNADHKFIHYVAKITAALYQPHIFHELAIFFFDQNILIEEIDTHCYQGSGGVTLFSVSIIIHLPTHLSIATLRNQFLDLCDNLNLDDAFLEPIQGR